MSLLGIITARFFHVPLKISWQTFVNGFNDGLRSCGLRPTRKYPAELWVWETMDDEDVCEDCRERATWPPLDIADWMKTGLPGTPESECECGQNCRCRLLRYKPSPFTPRGHQL